MLSSNSSKRWAKQFNHSTVMQKNEFVRLFFGRIVGLKKPLQLCLTFSTKNDPLYFYFGLQRQTTDAQWRNKWKKIWNVFHMYLVKTLCLRCNFQPLIRPSWLQLKLMLIRIALNNSKDTLKNVYIFSFFLHILTKNMFLKLIQHRLV